MCFPSLQDPVTLHFGCFGQSIFQPPLRVSQSFFLFGLHLCEISSNCLFLCLSATALWVDSQPLIPSQKPAIARRGKAVFRLSAQLSVVPFSCLCWILALQFLVASVIFRCLQSDSCCYCFFLYILSEFSICSYQNNWSNANYYILARSKSLTYDFENITQHVFAYFLEPEKKLASCLNLPMLQSIQDSL